MVTRRSTRTLMYVALALITFLVILPLIWLVFISLKDNAEIMRDPLSLPASANFSNYAAALEKLDLGLLYRNTALVACH